MKKTLIALAASLLAVSAFATVPVPVPTLPSGSITGSVTSTVSGGTSSYSTANGVNQTAKHGSFATSENCVTVQGVSLPGTNGAVVGTSAFTTGKTLTGGGGTGTGGTAAYATQVGFGDITSTAKVKGLNTTGEVTASSGVATGTFSETSTLNSQFQLSGSTGTAQNATAAYVGSSLLIGGVSSTAKGGTAGTDKTTTFAVGNGIANAGGLLNVGDVSNVGSFQNGSYSGTITRSFTTPTIGVGGPGAACVSNCH